MPEDQQQSRPVKRVKFSKDAVTLVVGRQDLEEILVHVDTLCQSSPVLKASLKKEWTQDESRTLRFPDDKPEVVDFYVQWLYSDKIPVPPLPPKSTENPSNFETMKMLFRAFAWGEKMQDDCFKDAMMDAFLKIASPAGGGLWNLLNYDLVTMTYQTTPDGSPLRKFLVDIFSNRCSSFALAADGSLNLPAEFSISVFNRLIAWRGRLPKGTVEKEDPSQRGYTGCTYHHHAKDEKCSQQTGK